MWGLGGEWCFAHKYPVAPAPVVEKSVLHWVAFVFLKKKSCVDLELGSLFCYIDQCFIVSTDNTQS